ncbi:MULTISPECIES: site-specific integrase [Streptomyces]|uniref:site-specific integrase n=1 Tax=Streptomyces TaxID=1883 RepID=UPI001F61016D|nr:MULTISPECIES: site-specific integrase [Streptomyces]
MQFEALTLSSTPRDSVPATCGWRRGYVFTSPTGEPLNPQHRHHKWKGLPKAAKVCDGCLREARHLAVTVLLILGVPDAIVDAIMGWEPSKSARMRRRYQHLTGRVLKETAGKISGLMWPARTQTAQEV